MASATMARAQARPTTMFKKLMQAFQAANPPVDSDGALREAQELIARGNAAEDDGRVDEAAGLYARAAMLAPTLPAAHLNLGIAQEALGQSAEARSSYGKVLSLHAGHPYGAYNLAKLDYTQGRFESAEALVRVALAGKGDLVHAWVLLASVLDAQGRLEEAADAIAHALVLQPRHVGALSNQAGILRRLGRLDEAEASAAQAVALQTDADSLALHGTLQATQGFAEEALRTMRRAVALAPQRADLRSRELFLLNLVDGPSPQEVYERHREFGMALEAAADARRHVLRRDRPRLRLGIVSEDFRVHPVALFLLPLLERLPRERFEVVCYSSTTAKDHVTNQVQALAARWVDVVGWEDARVADAIAADGVDILLDVQGHTGTTRLGVFAGRPAPVQVAWVGYLNTTGLARMDFRISDARCDPPAQVQSLHTETLLLLPQSQWCYRPFIPVDPAPEAPCERQGFVTFGSFNSAAKLTDAMVGRWARILRAVPDARMLVADVASLRKRAAILEQAGREGVAAERFEFAPRTDLESYYRLMHRVDIGLDSYPYGGGTTTLDALWMGVPVVAATGPASVSRSAASVLAVLGLTDWIAPSITDYEQCAIERAGDRAAIARLRRELRGRLRASPLTDEAGFVRDFAALLEQAWREHEGER